MRQPDKPLENPPATDYKRAETVKRLQYRYGMVIKKGGTKNVRLGTDISRRLTDIDKHLGEELAIDNLAEMASLSPFYYQRLFKRLVKKPVGEYIKLRRMGKATEALLQKDSRILDIALELGFTSHEHFTRTFKETFGMTPEEYRRNPTTLNRMTKPELSRIMYWWGKGFPW